MTIARKALGASGEARVARWYEARGCEVLDRNWRGKDGELDLVLRDGHTLVFCEVKTRTSLRFGLPAEAVTAVKQLRLRRLAMQWLAAHPERRGRELRFDVAGVVGAAVDVVEAAF